MDEKRCCETVRMPHSFSRYPCSRKGIIEAAGKFYCKQHSPAARKARADKVQAEYDAKWEKVKTNRRRRRAEVSACTGISTSALEAGAVRELVEAFKISIQYMPHTREPGYNAAAYKEAKDCRAVLARFEGGE